MRSGQAAGTRRITSYNVCYTKLLRLIREIRGRGLFVGMEIERSHGTARAVCEALMDRGLLSKETHETVVRLAPPLVIGKQEIDWALQQIREVLAEMDRVRLAS